MRDLPGRRTLRRHARVLAAAIVAIGLAWVLLAGGAGLVIVVASLVAFRKSRPD